MKYLKCKQYTLPLERPLVMGIVNVTPDSFSDGGQFNSAETAYQHAVALKQAGADILDIGGESTRPGSEAVSVQEELDRVMPVIEQVLPLGLPISLDTKKPEVMQAGLEAGVHIINDVNGFRAEGCLEVLAQHKDVGLCVMHMRGMPKNMQLNLNASEDVIKTVYEFLVSRARTLEGIGFQPHQIILDPGFGFGKTVDQNYQLLTHLTQLSALPYAVLIGLSRKSMLDAMIHRPALERDVATVVASLACIQRGANIVRVHNVQAMQDALMIHNRIESVW
ncbi:MAG: dihydropteroate synthase [Alcaligenaceae bacterium]|nr:dihydropteroate synthase [Alcaligenaceae bacterium]